MGSECFAPIALVSITLSTSFIFFSFSDCPSIYPSTHPPIYVYFLRLIEIKRIKNILQKTYLIAEKEQRKKTKEKRVKGNQRLS